MVIKSLFFLQKEKGGYYDRTKMHVGDFKSI